MLVAPLVGKARESVRLSDDHAILIFEGTVRSGKTIASLVAWLRYVRTGPPGNLAIIGRTQRTARQNIIDVLTDMLGESRCKYVEGTGILRLLGRRIYVVGANDEAAVTKIQGLTLAGAYVDEAATIPESFWNMLRSRLSVPGAKLWATSNPASPQHWLKVKWLNRASVHLTRDGELRRFTDPDRIDLARFSYKLEDNPNLSAQFVAQIKSDFTGLFYRRYVLGEWVAAEGAVYPMFDPDVHVVRQVPTIVKWPVVSADYGTTNPFHALSIGVGVDHRLYVVDEWRHDSRVRNRQMTDAEYSVAMRRWMGEIPIPGTTLSGPRHDWVVIDPSAKSFIVQLYRDGITAAPAINDVLDGIRLVSSLLGRGQLLISERCRGLIDELPGYSWDDKATLIGEDKPLKIDDHGCDALRYGTLTTQMAWDGLVRRSIPVAA